MKVKSPVFIASVLVLAGGLCFSAEAQWNEPVHAEKWMVSSGHPLATEAGLEILRKGGNAFDAAVATCMALNVTRPISAGAVGVTPTLIYDAATGEVKSYSGLGTAPAKGTTLYYRLQGWPVNPALGVNAQIIPAGPDTWIALLSDYGTMSFEEVVAPAIRLADGHVLNQTCAAIMELPKWGRGLYKRFFPYNHSIFYEPFEPYGPRAGDILVQEDLAKTQRLLVDAERRELERSGDRKKALEAVRFEFYEGEIARAIVRSQELHNGAIAYEDLANYRGKWEAPVSGTFGEYTVWANDTWCQGPTVPMILQLLEGIDLKAMGHNSPEYISTITQAVELAFGDREAYFGDPEFVDVPIKGLLSKEYAAERRELIDPHRAFGKMPPPGDPWKFEGRPGPKKTYQPRPIPTPIDLPISDTTYFCVVDAEGNAVSLTPSDFPYSPMVEDYGIMLGIRGSQFRLKAGHPARVEPGKRPRLTPNPSMVTRDGKMFMAFGTPGGDQQPQAMVQVFLNIVVWGMDPQAAINAPRFKSLNYPGSFSPHAYYPGRLLIEEDLAKLSSALKKQGYDLQVLKPPGFKMGAVMGAVCAIIRTPSGALVGGADPREESWAEGD
jgi:gamma-glutamyltranspeptidase/glutathione hydrolase